MQSRQHFGQAFDHPVPRQQYKAFFSIRQLDHLQFNAVPGGIAFSLLARITLVCLGELDHIASCVLQPPVTGWLIICQ